MINNAVGFDAFFVGLVGRVFNGNNPNNTMTLGSQLIVSTVQVPTNSALLDHELGHTPQAAAFEKAAPGFPGFLIGYASLAMGGVSHEQHVMERDANRRAGLSLDWNGIEPNDYLTHNPYLRITVGHRLVIP